MSTERDLVERYRRIVGYVPPMFTDLIRVLAHPDVISYTRKFLDEQEALEAQDE